MEGIYRIKRTVERLYRDWGNYLTAFGKFLAALLLFLQINSKIGGVTILNNPFVVLILSLFCSFLPMNMAVVLGSMFIFGNLYALSLSALVAGGGILLIVLLLYFCFAKSEACAFVLTPIALGFHIPLSLPLAFGLLGKPLAGAGVAAGTVVYYMMIAVRDVAVTGAGASVGSEDAFIGEIEEMLDKVLGEQEMILMLIALTAVILVVYFTRRMAMKYAWTVAIGAGTVIYLAIVLSGCLMLELRSGFLTILIGTLVSVLFAGILETGFFHLDYTQTERLQFEDDDYYYYVQAVPKKHSSKTDMKTGRKGRGVDDAYKNIYP